MFEAFSTQMQPELLDLAHEFGAPLIFHADALSPRYIQAMGGHGQRQAEVCMVIQRPTGRLLTITKTFYPAGIFRLPSGGVEAHEAIIDALLREVQEETGLQVRIARFLAAIAYRAQGATRFATFAFAMDEVGGTLGSNDPNENIAAYREIAGEDLAVLADQLEHLAAATSPDWHENWSDWGNFRAVVHRQVWLALQDHPKESPDT